MKPASLCTSAAARVLLPLASLAALLFALTVQYGFGVAPCHLCLWQRVPYALVVLLGLFYLSIRGQSEERLQALVPVMLIVLIVECGLAFFHSGVEQHWWGGPKGCVAPPFDGTTASLLATPVVACDHISWSFLGLSMAGWNGLYALTLTLYALIVIHKRKTLLS